MDISRKKFCSVLELKVVVVSDEHEPFTCILNAEPKIPLGRVGIKINILTFNFASPADYDFHYNFISISFEVTID